ncbi:MAG: hypothetical protein K0R92_2857 [Lachnospiraceae bacterium]|jgi:putative phosphoesterase|nr:hypothetical protein [Lachnospiraceae bacterium]
MKILIVSDSHGRNYYLEKVIERVKPIDLLIHLGDIEGSENIIRDMAPCKVEIVAGNNDFFSGMEKEKVITVGSYTIFLAHGHRYAVNYSTEKIKDAARFHNASIAMFGHTHRPLLDLSGSVWAINPGSISQPRQDDGIPTYIIMDIDTKGQIHFTLNRVYKDNFMA